MKCTTTKTDNNGIVFYGMICKCESDILRVDDITTDKKSITELCRKIERGNVTMVTVMDIINDFME